MRVELIATTEFYEPESTPWVGEVTANDADLLAEFAGRACYQSWNRPNPKTATNEGYLHNILDKAHFSVIEHASASFYITGVSRSLTHELIRHRHFSYSQESQRYVKHNGDYIIPHDILNGSQRANEVFARHMEESYRNYLDLYDELSQDTSLSKKEVTGGARSVLSNAHTTSIVISANHRAYMEFLSKRLSNSAEHEIRALARKLFDELVCLAPNTYQNI